MNILQIDQVRCPKCDWTYQPTKLDSWIVNQSMKARCEKCHHVFIFEPWWTVNFLIFDSMEAPECQLIESS